MWNALVDLAGGPDGPIGRVSRALSAAPLLEHASVKCWWPLRLGVEILGGPDEPDGANLVRTDQLEVEAVVEIEDAVKKSASDLRAKGPDPRA